MLSGLIVRDPATLLCVHLRLPRSSAAHL